MLLIEPTMEYRRQIEAYREEFLSCGDSMDGTGALRRFERAADWLEHTNACKHAETVPHGLAPATQYIFVREKDRKIVGMIQIRHYLNDYLKQFGGHIGYCVAPSERRNGYAAEMLRLTLPKCSELGLSAVLITCDKDNEGSRRTILKNGGVYESTVYEPEEAVWVERYWIRLAAAE